MIKGKHMISGHLSRFTRFYFYAEVVISNHRCVKEMIYQLQMYTYAFAEVHCLDQLLKSPIKKLKNN